MDKYLILITKLQTELASLNLELKNIEDEIKEKKLSISNLKSTIGVTNDQININKNKIRDRKSKKKYFKEKKLRFLKWFAIFSLILSACLILPGFLVGSIAGIITKIFISLGISTVLVGGAYAITTYDDLKYFNSIDVDELYHENYNLSEFAMSKAMEQKQIKSNVKELEEKRNELQENITSKTETLNNTCKVRNDIWNDIMGELIEQKINESETLGINSKQKVLRNQ